MRLTYLKDNKKALYSIMLMDGTLNCHLHDVDLSPEQNKIGIVLSVLEDVLDKYGKPKELFVCDNEIISLTEDFCCKFGIKLTKTKTLPEIEKARKSFLNEIR